MTGSVIPHFHLFKSHYFIVQMSKYRVYYPAQLTPVNMYVLAFQEITPSYNDTSVIWRQTVLCMICEMFEYSHRAMDTFSLNLQQRSHRYLTGPAACSEASNKPTRSSGYFQSQSVTEITAYDWSCSFSWAYWPFLCLAATFDLQYLDPGSKFNDDV